MSNSLGGLDVNPNVEILAALPHMERRPFFIQNRSNIVHACVQKKNPALLSGTCPSGQARVRCSGQGQALMRVAKERSLHTTIDKPFRNLRRLFDASRIHSRRNTAGETEECLSLAMGIVVPMANFQIVLCRSNFMPDDDPWSPGIVACRSINFFKARETAEHTVSV